MILSSKYILSYIKERKWIKRGYRESKLRKFILRVMTPVNSNLVLLNKQRLKE